MRSTSFRRLLTSSTSARSVSVICSRSWASTGSPSGWSGAAGSAICGIRAEDCELLRPLPQLGQRFGDHRIEGMAREDGVKPVLPRLVGDRPRDELDEVDAVLRERLERAVKCPG